MKNLYMKFYSAVCRVEDFLCAVGLLFITFGTCWDIADRYWLHTGKVMWLNDFVVYIFTLMAILAIIITTRANAHTVVDMLINALFKTPRSKKGVLIAINCVSLYVIYLIWMPFYNYFLKAMKRAEWGTLCPFFNTSWIIEALFIMLVMCAYHLVHNNFVLLGEICAKEADSANNA